MTKNFVKYFILITVSIILAIFYLTIFGIETKKFNNKIKNKIMESNSDLVVDLRKIKLTLDPFNFKINAKTIGTNIVYGGKNLELEYIKTKISLISLIKNKFISSSLKISSKTVNLKDLISFIRAKSNTPELFILEMAVKKGRALVDLDLNFDENGNIKQDYKINVILKNAHIGLYKNYNFEKINFLLNVKDNILDFKDISFRTNKIDFFSDNLKITPNKKNFLFEGKIQNKAFTLNNDLLKLMNLNLKNLNFFNINFISKNKFSFNINDNFQLKNLIIKSDIQIIESKYKKPPSLSKHLPEVNDVIYFKDHKLKTEYKKNNFIIEGFGKVKLKKKFNKIEYKISINEKNIDIFSNMKLSELKLRSHQFLKPFFPKLNKTLDLKNQHIELSYNNHNLSIKGYGKVKLEKEFENVNYTISKIRNKFNFESQIDLDNTLFNIDFLDFKKDDKSKTQLTIIGNYNDKKELSLKEISVTENKNKIKFENLLLDKNNKIKLIDKADLNYLDSEKKRNKLSLQRIENNNYIVNGSLFNANRLITDLLKKKEDDKKIFKNDLSLKLNLRETFIDKKNIINDLKGKLYIKDNKLVKANITAFYDSNDNLTFTVNTNNGEKITTLYSSRAKPLVNRYKFIKGFKDSKEGYLDFYSSKKNGVSNSKLVIDNFKVKEIPALAKLLALASLQGIADLLTGEGIRFTDFEMNFTNENELMRIQELYAIGPAISILLEGYVETDNLISLRGTLVPATTINRSIASLPLIGNLLIGRKVGEGVFGVSFKIKGSPKNLETTVNPIKTLTPRFITRTLEKIKRN